MVTNTLMTFASLIWGIQNNGEPQRINIDHFTSGYVIGVKGEDLHLPPPVYGEDKIIVAVLDTGIDSEHPDLKNKIAPGGYNFVQNNENTLDSHGHGTHISGIIAQQVTQHALILPVKVVQTGPNAPVRPQDTGNGAGTALTENVAKGMVYAIQKGAKVINLSLAWPGTIRSNAVDEAMKLAIEKGVIVVASAANDSTSANLYPCIYSNVVCVGAHGPDGSFTYFSNHGSMVDVLAPGIAILSTWPMNKAPVTFAGQVGYEFRNGTSMAAPFVSGAAAELLFRGYSPKETINRLLLGSRPIRQETLYQTSVRGDFSKNNRKESKLARFGNLDLTGSLEVHPQPFIVPETKANIEIEWNGIESSVKANIKWVNQWKKSSSTRIQYATQVFYFDHVDENETISTPIRIPIHSNTESNQILIATVVTESHDGKIDSRQFPISIQIKRIITPSSLPKNSTSLKIQGLEKLQVDRLRSVVSSEKAHDLGFYFKNGNELGYIGKTGLISQKNISGIDQESILNLYRIQPDRFGLISLKKGKDQRDLFVIRILDQSLEVLNTDLLDTNTTLLNENLIWKPIGTTLSPLWISAGVIPSPDLPPFDPWNPVFENQKLPRIYFIQDGKIRTILLENDELPLKILPDQKVLIAKGNSYYSEYFTLDIQLNLKTKIQTKTKIALDQYRMLLGLDSSVQNIDLKDGHVSGTVFSGTSTPGNIRMTTILSEATGTKDVILKRENTLDSLIQLLASFENSEQSYYFIQSRYDLKFFRSSSTESSSVSLNRFSYIPSMIFNRSFFPIVLGDAKGERLPGLYVPASFVNNETSEIMVGDPATGKILKPASLRLKAMEGCRAVGNLIPANSSEVSKLVFFCQDQLVLVPIEL